MGYKPVEAKIEKLDKDKDVLLGYDDYNLTNSYSTWPKDSWQGWFLLHNYADANNKQNFKMFRTFSTVQFACHSNPKFICNNNSW